MPEKIPNDSGEQEADVLRGSVEVVPTPDEHLAVCVIKPGAFEHREAIIRRLENSGLYVVQRATRQLTDSFVVGVMYKKHELSSPRADATRKHFAEGPSEVILLQGEHAAQKLLEAVGMETTPGECNPQTIRYIYGDHIPRELEPGLTYYRNAAHRPRTQEEAKKDLEKFRGLY